MGLDEGLQMLTQMLHEERVEDLLVSVYPTNAALGGAAAAEASALIREMIREKDEANLIVGAANSQLTFFAALGRVAEVHWSKVNIFPMDEYLEIDREHPATFSRFLHRHLLDHIAPRAFFPILEETVDPTSACSRYEQLLHEHPSDLCVLGFGENGHLAFNDPPFADFSDPKWVKVVELADASRRQQVGEGHFAALHDVPTHAITLTIPAVLAARHVLAVVPEARKALAVFRALRGPISPECPASILRRIPNAHLFLDIGSAGNALSMQRP